MRTLMTNSGRMTRLLAILALTLTTVACGDESEMYDDNFVSENHSLTAVEPIDILDDQQDFDIVGQTADDQHDKELVHFAKRYDFTRFDGQTHRIDIDEEIDSPLDLNVIEQFEFDCDDSSANCGPAGASNVGFNSVVSEEQGDDEGAEDDDLGLRNDLEFDPERHRVEITPEIRNTLDLERIQKFGLDCNDTRNDCVPGIERGVQR